MSCSCIFCCHLVFLFLSLVSIFRFSFMGYTHLITSTGTNKSSYTFVLIILSILYLFRKSQFIFYYSLGCKQQTQWMRQHLPVLGKCCLIGVTTSEINSIVLDCKQSKRRVFFFTYLFPFYVIWFLSLLNTSTSVDMKEIQFVQTSLMTNRYQTSEKFGSDKGRSRTRSTRREWEMRKIHSERPWRADGLGSIQ